LAKSWGQKSAQCVFHAAKSFRGTSWCQCSAFVFCEENVRAAKTVIVQMVKEQGPLDEHYHMYYETSGTGKAYMFRDGEAVVGTWSKKSDPTRTKFTTADGKEFEFNRGQVWIELVSTAHPPVYE
jgi:hypothetical protein